jgi:hypothetical protein
VAAKANWISTAEPMGLKLHVRVGGLFLKAFQNRPLAFYGLESSDFS